MSFFFVFVIGVLTGFASCAFLLGLSEKITRFYKYWKNKNIYKLPFVVPFKYTLEPHSFFDYQSPTCKEFLVRILFETELCMYRGKLIVGSMQNGIWGFKSFELEGIGSPDDVQLKIGTDLLQVNQEINKINDVFEKNGINVTMTSRLKQAWELILKDVNNLSVLTRNNKGT